MMKKRWILFLAVIFAAGLAGTTYASDIDLGGSLRVRAVTVDNEDRATGNQGEGFIEQRTRINVNADVNDTTRVFIQLNNATGWGGDGLANGTGTGATVGLSQGYLELSDVLDQPLTLRLGRQALAYGNHRLVGSLEWTSTARRFDALKLIYNHDAFSVDAWYSKLFEAANNVNDTDFHGIYLTLKAIPDNTVDFYLLNQKSGQLEVQQNEFTYGVRVNGNFADLDYTAEVAAQTGDTGIQEENKSDGTSADRDALAFAIKAGYTLPDLMGLRVGAEYDSATGDEASTLDKDEGFNNLYPTNHYLYGQTDDIGWSDMQAWSVNVSAKPMDSLKVAVEYWNYTADEVATGLKDDLGTEINVRGNYKISDNVSAEAAYVLRDAGDAGDGGRPESYIGTIADAIPKDKTSTFAYLMINVNF